MAGRLWWMVLAAWVMQAVLLVLVVDARWVYRTAAMEQAAWSRWMGADSAARIERVAGRLFRLTVDGTGLREASYAFFTPRTERADDPGRAVGRWLMRFAWGRLDALWALWAHGLRRAVAATLWGPFLVLVLVPAVWQGWCRRRLRQESFEYASAVRQRYALRVVVLAIAAALTVLAWPWPVPPVLWPALVALVAVSMQIAVANFPKRI